MTAIGRQPGNPAICLISKGISTVQLQIFLSKCPPKTRSFIFRVSLLNMSWEQAQHFFGMGRGVDVLKPAHHNAAQRTDQLRVQMMWHQEVLKISKTGWSRNRRKKEPFAIEIQEANVHLQHSEGRHPTRSCHKKRMWVPLTDFQRKSAIPHLSSELESPLGRMS